MTAFLAWYLASSLLGWLTFPLVFRLFPALADRGYTLARTAGLLLWGWLFWMLASLGILRNDLGGLLFAFLILVGLSVFSLFGGRYTGTHVTRNPYHVSPDLQLASLKTWLRANLRLLFTTEILFLIAFAFLAFVRAANPEAVATEKPMELAFINGILRSPTLPPNDPWMSGYSISYYHFGYIMAAMFARLTGVLGSVAFNLMSALVFALAAVGSFGISYNLLVATDDRRPSTDDSRLPSSVIGLALLAPLFLLILSNAEGFLEIIHGLGWFWPSQPLTADSQQPIANFWTWLNIKDLSSPPTGDGWIPDRFWWWWRASRVVQDYDLANNWSEVIDEFPYFSFLLGDLHPHVLALPFNMLGIGVALNLFLGGWRGILNFLDYRLHITLRDFLFAALVLGGLAFLNTWDILPAAALIVGAYVLVRVRAEGWSWQRLEDAVLLGIPLAVSAFILYLPFYLGFSSQAGGLLPNLVLPTRGAHLWVMWGTLLLPILAWLIWQTRTLEARPRLGAALAWTVGLILFLWAFSWLLALLVRWREPLISMQYLTSQGQTDFASLFRSATVRRLSYIGGLLSIASVFWLSIAHLLRSPVNTYTGTHVDRYTGEQADMEHREASPWDATRESHLLTPNSYPLSSLPFTLLLVALASLLILAPDFVYLQDGFGYRINTVFKFYYQAWQLWALAAAFGTVILLQNLRRVWGVIWRVAFVFILAAGLAYPILATLNKTNDFQPPNGFTLDGAAHLDRESPEDAEVIRYLQSAPLGVVAEAVGGSYTNYARIATHTGQPTVLGWPWHEYQWRGNWDAHGTRESDIRTLYEVPAWDTAKAILDRYQIRYVVVGTLERTTYNVNETKFQQHLIVLFQAGTTVIYGVP